MTEVAAAQRDTSEYRLGRFAFKRKSNPRAAIGRWLSLTHCSTTCVGIALHIPSGSSVRALEASLDRRGCSPSQRSGARGRSTAHFPSPIVPAHCSEHRQAAGAAAPSREVRVAPGRAAKANMLAVREYNASRTRLVGIGSVNQFRCSFWSAAMPSGAARQRRRWRLRLGLGECARGQRHCRDRHGNNWEAHVCFSTRPAGGHNSVSDAGFLCIGAVGSPAVRRYRPHEPECRNFRCGSASAVLQMTQISQL